MSQVSTRRNRGGWTTEGEDYLAVVRGVIDGLRMHWPLTLRQVYYQLVASLTISNARSSYQKLSRILSKARIDGLVPWEALEDRVRSSLVPAAWTDESDFITSDVRQFLLGYRRDVLAHQDRALEVWIEKDALSRLCAQVAHEYCVPVMVARGFSSVSYLNECRNRVRANAASGRPTTILYFGDLDPSGWEMLPSMLKTLKIEMGLDRMLEGVRCALLPAQVEAYGLPRSVDAMKEKDTRTPEYRKKFGDLAVEIDALRPDVLQSLVRRSIEQHLDMAQLREDLGHEEAERMSLAGLRKRVMEFVSKERGESR